MTQIQKGRKNYLARSIESVWVYFMEVQVEAKDTVHSHVTGNGGVSGHRLGREVVVTVGAVEERLSPLAVDKIGLQDEA